MKLSRIINASGKMTILGGSKVDESVAEKMVFGAQNLFLMEELIEVSGNHIANLFGVESASIVASASAGIAQAVASVISNDHVLDPYNTNNLRRNIVMPKGHNVDYGTTIAIPIQMGGGVVVEAGYANACSLDHVESKIDENTAALLFVKSHHAVQKGMPDLKEFIELGHKHGLPVIVDAAAEGDVAYYHHLGADAVIYSGTKTFEGPTSGVVIGTHDFITKLRHQSKGIGRVMKVGKEGILGLVQALDNHFVHEDVSLDDQKKRLEIFHSGFEGILKSRNVQDGAGRPILRCELTFSSSEETVRIVNHLKSGDVKIYTRDYRANEGIIELDIRDLSDDEMKEIVVAIKEGL